MISFYESAFAADALSFARSMAKRFTCFPVFGQQN
jgi:hypothetical protein